MKTKKTKKTKSYPKLKQSKSKKSSKPSKLTKEEKAQKAFLESEAKKWTAFAIEKNITTPFFIGAGCFRRTSDGKAYGSFDDLFADGLEKDWSNVTNADINN